MQGWGDNNRDGDVYAQATLSTVSMTRAPGDTNYGNFKNAALDDLIDKADVEMDLAKRQTHDQPGSRVGEKRSAGDPDTPPGHSVGDRAPTSRMVHRSDNKFAPLWVTVK